MVESCPACSLVCTLWCVRSCNLDPGLHLARSCDVPKCEGVIRRGGRLFSGYILSGHLLSDALAIVCSAPKTSLRLICLRLEQVTPSYVFPLALSQPSTIAATSTNLEQTLLLYKINMSEPPSITTEPGKPSHCPLRVHNSTERVWSPS